MRRLLTFIGREGMTLREQREIGWAQQNGNGTGAHAENEHHALEAAQGQSPNAVAQISDALHQRLGMVAPELSERLQLLQHSQDIAAYAGFDEQDTAKAIAREWGIPLSEGWESGMSTWEQSIPAEQHTRMQEELQRRREVQMQEALQNPTIVRGLLTDTEQSVERAHNLAQSLEQAMTLELQENPDLTDQERAAISDELDQRRKLIAKIPAEEIALLLANTPRSIESLTMNIADAVKRAAVVRQLEENPHDADAISIALRLEERISDPTQRQRVLQTLSNVFSNATKLQNFGRSERPDQSIDPQTWTAWKREYLGELELRRNALLGQLHVLLTQRYEDFIRTDQQRLLAIASNVGLDEALMLRIHQGDQAALDEAERRSFQRYGVSFSAFQQKMMQRALAASAIDRIAQQRDGERHLPSPDEPDFLTRADQMLAEMDRLEREEERLDPTVDGFAGELQVEQRQAEERAVTLAKRARALLAKGPTGPIPGIGDPREKLEEIDAILGKYADVQDPSTLRADYPRCVTPTNLSEDVAERMEQTIAALEHGTLELQAQSASVERYEERRKERTPLATIEANQLSVRVKIQSLLEGILPTLDAPICGSLHVNRTLQEKASHLEGIAIRAAASAEKAGKVPDDEQRQNLERSAQDDWARVMQEVEQLEHAQRDLAALTIENVVYEPDTSFPTEHEMGFFDLQDRKIHLRTTLKDDQNAERRRAAWMHEKGHATLNILRDSGVLPFFLLSHELALAHRAPDGEQSSFEALLLELVEYYHIDALRPEFQARAQKKFAGNPTLAAEYAKRLEREYLLEELHSRFGDARDLARPSIAENDPKRTAKLAEQRLFDLLREGDVPQAVTNTPVERALRSGRLYTTGTEDADQGDEGGAEPPAAETGDEASNIKNALAETKANLYKVSSFVDVYRGSNKPKIQMFIEQHSEEVTRLLGEVEDFDRRFSSLEPVTLTEIDQLKLQVKPLVKEVNEMDRDAWDIRSEAPVKKATWWDNFRFMSVLDVIKLWKDVIEDFKTIYNRNQQRLLQDVGNALYDAMTNQGKKIPIVGDRYFAKLKGYHERRYADAELESVGKWKKAMEKLDTHQILHILSGTKNFDQIRGCIEMICDRGEMDWNNVGVWRTLQKISGYKMPEDACMRDDILRDTWLRKMISKTWTDAELFYKWRMNNDSNTESHKKKFVQQVDQFSNVSGGLSGNLERQLKLWTQWHEQEHECEKRGIPPPKFPDDVKPHLYEEVIEYSIKNGKMTMEQKMYYIVQGVASGLLPIERLRALAGQHGSIINLFPYIEYFYGHNNTVPEIKALARRLTERGSDGKPTFSPGLRTTLWIHFEVSRDEQVRRRLSKGSTRKAEDIDHEDIPFFVTQMDYSEMSNMLDVISGGRQKVTPEGLKNAYVGFNSKMKIFGNLAKMERDHLERFTGDDAKAAAKNLAAYILMDNSLTLNGAATGKKPPSLALSQFKTQAVSSPNGETAWQYREKMTRFIQALNRRGIFDSVKWNGDQTVDRNALGVSKNAMLALDPNDPNQGYQRNTDTDMKRILSDNVFPRFAQQLEQAIKDNLPAFKEVLMQFEGQFLDECGSEGLSYAKVQEIKRAERAGASADHAAGGGH